MMHTYIQTLINVPTKSQPSTPYKIQEMAWTTVQTYGHCDKVKGQINITPRCCTPITSKQCPYQVSTSYTLWFPRYCHNKILQVKVNTARSKVKSRSHHYILHLQPLTNVPSKYQLLLLTVSEIWSGQDFIGQGQYSKVKGQI